MKAIAPLAALGAHYCGAGDTYYYNSMSDTSQWEVPPELEQPRERPKTAVPRYDPPPTSDGSSGVFLPDGTPWIPAIPGLDLYCYGVCSG
jgi:hypothetical protein